MSNSKNFNGYSTTASKIAYLNRQLNKTSSKTLSLNDIVAQSNYFEKLTITSSTEGIYPTQNPSFVYTGTITAIGDKTVTIDPLSIVTTPCTLFLIETLLVTNLNNGLYTINSEAETLQINELWFSRHSNNTYISADDLPTGAYEAFIRTLAISNVGAVLTTVEQIPQSKIGAIIHATTNILI